MRSLRTFWIVLTILSAVPALGQRRYVLADGITGRDRMERLLLIQAFSAQSDSLTVMTDTLGHFEIDPAIMDRMHGDVYLRPMSARPKVRLTLVNPFDTIDAYRQGRMRYLAQDYISVPEEKEHFHYDSDVTVLSEARVMARRRRYGVVRDRVTGYLDSLTLLKVPEWVCQHGYLNDYHGYSHHPGNMGVTKRTAPERGKEYRVIKYIVWPDHPEIGIVDPSDPPHEVVYYGPQYTEEDLLEMYGMSKAQGYFPEREFYEPDELDLAAPTPDFRNLLQWRPAVLTDENGVAEIPFTASDVNTEFVGLVEAVDGTGLLGTQSFVFRVMK